MENEHENVIVTEITSEDLLQLVRTKNRTGLIDVFEKVPTIDIAEAANDFEPSDLIAIFRLVKSEYTADFFDGLSQDTKENLIKAMTDKELVTVINSQSADDIVDAVAEMPANLASRVLKAADKDMRADINTLLNYKDGTAGALMTTEYLEFASTTTVAKTIAEIRAKGKDAETIYTIFVRNRSRQFVGTADLDDLIFAKDDETLEDIMNIDVAYCFTSTDQEEIAQMFRRYDLNAMAVLNEDRCLIGVITVDDAVDVMTEEAQEDLALATHMSPSSKSYMETTPWENAKKSFPWLIALLVLGTFTTMILNRLESQRIFASMGILIAFVPALMDTGGNAGGQTTGLMIRALALDEFGPKDTGKVIWREIRAAAIVAAIVGAFAFFWITIEQYTGIVNLGVIPAETPLDFTNTNIWNGNCWNWEFSSHALLFSALVALTMFSAIFVSKCVGTLLPMAASAIKKDPALLSQPMLTTIMDALTLVIYFLIACAFFPAYA